MRPLMIALALSLIFPSSMADTVPCPNDQAVAAQELAAGHRLYMVAHTSKGWLLMMFGTPTGDAWVVYAINGKHEACVSSEGDHLEIVRSVQ